MDRLLSSRRVLFSFLLPLIAAGATALLLYSTPKGLGINDDSIAYVAGARSLLSGSGYREIWLVSAGYVTHFPPGFPSALALISVLTGIDPLRSARLLNGLLFALNTFLVGWLTLRMTGSRTTGILAALLFLLTPSLLSIHSNAMSEPLYVFFTLVVFLLLDFYFHNRTKHASWLWLLGAGSWIGLAYLTRYAGLALLAAAIVAALILHPVWRQRATAIGILIAGFIPWIAAWAVRNRIVGGSLTNRVLGWHPITLESARQGIRTFSSFLVPVDDWHSRLIKVDGLFEACLVILALALLAWLLRSGLRWFFHRPGAVQPEVISFLNGLYLFAYFLSLVVTMTFFDPATKFQLRIVAPIFVSLLMLLAYALNRLSVKNAGRGVALLLAGLVLAVSAFGQGANLADLRRGGQVYANERWFDAPAIAALRQLPAHVTIHTNQPGVVYLYVGRPGALLPDDAAGIPDLQAKVRSGDAVIAIFRTVGADKGVLAFYDLLGEGLVAKKYNGDVIYSSP
jgi:4-amino-4-deoxy-L-arabinose transferase-like glycosyltransferase